MWFDAHARFREGGDQLDTTIVRAGLGWRATPRLDLWAAYAHVTLRRDGPDGVEHRTWQQATYPITEIGGGRLAGRTRLEQRFEKVATRLAGGFASPCAGAAQSLALT